MRSTRFFLQHFFFTASSVFVPPLPRFPSFFYLFWDVTVLYSRFTRYQLSHGLHIYTDTVRLWIKSWKCRVLPKKVWNRFRFLHLLTILEFYKVSIFLMSKTLKKKSFKDGLHFSKVKYSFSTWIRIQKMKWIRNHTGPGKIQPWLDFPFLTFLKSIFSYTQRCEYEIFHFFELLFVKPLLIYVYYVPHTFTNDILFYFVWIRDQVWKTCI